VFPVTASRPVCQTGLPVDHEFFASCSLHPPFVHLAACNVISSFEVEGRGALVHLRASGPCRFTPGALAPVRVIVSRSIITYSAPSAPLASTSRLRRRAVYTQCLRCAHNGLSDQRVVPGFRWLTVSACRPPGRSSVASIQSVHRRHWPSTSLEGLGASHAPHPPLSWGSLISGLHYGSLSLRPADLLALLSERAKLSPSPRGLLLPGFRRIGHPH